MIDARNEIMHSYPLQQPYMDVETEAHIMDKLMDLPAEEVPRALAKYAVQRSLRLEFTPAQHIRCASPQATGRTWTGCISQILQGKYGDSKGFTPADAELESIMLDLDEVIYD